MRKPIIAGNWKMNNTAAQGAELVNALKPLVKDADCDVVVCVPFTDIPAVSKALEGSNIRLGAQNVHFAEKGAYTGEISADMLKEYGVEYGYLFGSYAKGKATERSDVDLLVAMPTNGLKFFGLVEALREGLNKKVDVLDIGQLNNNIALTQEILKDGIKIYG